MKILHSNSLSVPWPSSYVLHCCAWLKTTQNRFMLTLYKPFLYKTMLTIDYHFVLNWNQITQVEPYEQTRSHDYLPWFSCIWTAPQWQGRPSPLLRLGYTCGWSSCRANWLLWLGLAYLQNIHPLYILVLTSVILIQSWYTNYGVFI